jgi:cytochrome c oxidase subunit II
MNVREDCVMSRVVGTRVFWGVLAAGVLLAAVGSPLALAAPTPAQAVSLEVTARRFRFEPDRLEVVEGDLVALAVKSADGTHGIEIRQLKLKREVPRDGSSVLMTFTAPAPGSYDITCSEYCGRGHDRMAATLIVRPRTSSEGR